MPWQTAPAGSAGGRFIEWCRVFGTTPLTCTIFDPVHFGSILRNYVSHISPTRLKLSIMGTTSPSVLKSHTGATRALTGARESRFVWRESKVVHYYRFFSVLVFWHKRKFAVKSVLLGNDKKKYAPNQKIDLQTFFFRVNITHHEGEFFCFVSCVLQDVLKSRNPKMDWLNHPCRPRCQVRNSGILAYQLRLPVF